MNAATKLKLDSFIILLFNQRIPPCYLEVNGRFNTELILCPVFHWQIWRRLGGQAIEQRFEPLKIQLRTPVQPLDDFLNTSSIYADCSHFAHLLPSASILILFPSSSQMNDRNAEFSSHKEMNVLLRIL